MCSLLRPFRLSSLSCGSATPHLGVSIKAFVSESNIPVMKVLPEKMKLRRFEILDLKQATLLNFLCDFFFFIFH